MYFRHLTIPNTPSHKPKIAKKYMKYSSKCIHSNGPPTLQMEFFLTFIFVPKPWGIP